VSEPEIIPPPDDEPRPPRLPGAIKAASIILIALGVLGLLDGLQNILYFSGNEEFLEETGFSSTTVRVQGGINLVIGVALILIGIQIRKGNNAARRAALVLCGLGLLFGILSLPFGLLATLLNGAVLYLLAFRRDSKEFFGRSPRPAVE
jgi:hypothetical protein